MEIKTLQDTNITDLTIALNEAFSDYIVPVHWTEEAAALKFEGDNVDLSLSPGCFIDGKLCGFILHFVGRRNGRAMLWNGGTGVVPTQRGQGITSKLYDFILPSLINSNYAFTTLEVIDHNDPAIHIYQKNGFSRIRNLDCYKGRVDLIPPPKQIAFKSIDNINWKAFHTCRSWQPSFQNDDQKLKRMRAHIEVIGAYDKDLLVGYIIFNKNPEAGDVYQFAVKETYRKRGIGKSLFGLAAKDKTVPSKVINVDAAHRESFAFFKKIGFEDIGSQFEMIRTLEKAEE